MCFKFLYLASLSSCLILFSCERESNNFDYEYWLNDKDSFPNVVAGEFINVNSPSSLIFKKTDILDSTKPVEFVTWNWKSDTIIKNTTYNVLESNTGLDIIIPDNLFFKIDNTGANRYVKGYRYPLFDLYYAGNSFDSTYYTWGIGNHKYLYSYKSPIAKGSYKGYSRKQIESRIDSIADFGDIGKRVDLTFTHTFGITKVEFKRLYYSIDNTETITHIVFERVN